MADITYECPNCSNTNTVSEFVDPDSLVCRFCGDKLEMEEPEGLKPKPSLQKPKSQEKIVNRPQPARRSRSELWRFHGLTIKKKRTGPGKIHLIASWIIFLVFGGFMIAWRYGGGVTTATIPAISQIGAIFIIGMHIYIVALGFKDSMFNGLMCAIVPFYSFYYFFVLDGNCYLRAITGGLMAGIGVDGSMVVQRFVFSIVSAIYDWLARGVY